ncbi:MAG: hypothetical protein ACXW3X_18030, partial [Rhodoplanes sp.]
RGGFGKRDLWALDILAEEGFEYDSSIRLSIGVQMLTGIGVQMLTTPQVAEVAACPGSAQEIL